MKIILETKRLVLREFTIDDVQMFYDLCKDPEVVKYVGEEPLSSLQQAESILKEKILENQYEQFGFGRWAIHLKANGIFIGWCGLKNDEGEIDLGFRFRKRFWGKGFATEAAKAVLDYGFGELKLDKIHAKAMKENEASIAVIKKTGMIYRPENKSQNSCESVCDEYFELTQEEWENQK